MSAIAQTPANVAQLTTSGITNNITNGFAAAGVTIVAGNMVSLADASAQTYSLADADVSGVKVPAGMALGGAGPGQPFFIQTKGTVNPGSVSMTSGSMIYLSVTSGGITETFADIGSGFWSVSLGQALTNGSLYLNLTGQAVAKP